MTLELGQQPLFYAAQHWPEKTALITPLRTFNYRELHQQVLDIVQQLTQQGVQSGQHVMAIGENSSKLILLQLACLQMEVLFCPVSPRFTDSELQALTDKLDANWLWQPDTTRIISGQQRAISISISSSTNKPLLEAPSKLKPKQACNIILSSGSSGQPKAIVHSYENHFFSAQGAQQLIPLTFDDRWLLSLPIYHIGGLAIVMRCLLAGATLVLPNQHDLAQQIRTQSITHLSLVSTQLWRLLRSDALPRAQVNNIKACIVGGGPVSSELIKQAKKQQLPCFISYGLTEMSSQVATSKANAQQNCGQALSGRELSLINGEICLRGKVLAIGLYHQGLAPLPLDNNGWYHSGDLAELNAQGLMITGRLSNLFISGGENIHPEEIERHLLELNNIKNAIVIPIDDPEFGQRPLAIIDWQEACADEQYNAQNIDQYLSQHIAKFKIPDIILHWPVHLRQTGLKPNRKQLSQFVRDWQGNQLSEPIAQLRGLGKQLALQLIEIGVYNRQDLCQLGAVPTYVKLTKWCQAQCSTKPSLNLLYALVAAIEQRPWLEIAQQERERLLTELDADNEYHRN